MTDAIHGTVEINGVRLALGTTGSGPAVVHTPASGPADVAEFLAD